MTGSTPYKLTPEIEAETAQIYALCHAQTGEVRYIGKANDAHKRLASHMRDSRRRDTPLYRWIRKNGTPTVKVLVHASLDWREDEKRIIAEYRAAGAKLLNVADGGDEPFCPPEVRSQNARKATERRPKNLMIAYRRMEKHISHAKRVSSPKYQKYVAAYERLKRVAGDLRRVGALHKLDEALGVYFAEKVSKG